MTEPSRRTRPVASRTEPNRSWAQNLDRSAAAEPATEAGSAEAPGARPPPSSSNSEPAYDAVSNAYRLIDDYLRQGQRFAESVWLPFQSDARGQQSFNAPGRLLRAMSDMTNAWFELLQQSGGSTDPGSQWAPVGTAGPFSSGNPPAAAAGAASPTPQAAPGACPPFGLRLQASGRIEVAVELSAACESSALRATELCSLMEGSDPIRSVSVEVSDRKAPVLEIVVPDAQPPGTYNGLLLDRTTQRPCGIISLSVLGEQ
jgi:hypothetical protein